MAPIPQGVIKAGLGVPKLEVIWSQSSEKSILGKGVLPVVDGCNNIQKVECFLRGIAFVGRSTWICEPSVLSNGVNLHWRLRRSRFPVYRSAFHRELHNIGCRRLRRHRYSTAWLVERVPSRLVTLPKFFAARHPNSEYNGCLDPLPSERRFRFFLSDKGVQLVQFCFFDLIRYRSRRQFGSVVAHPIGNALWIDLQNPSNWPITVAFHVHANC